MATNECPFSRGFARRVLDRPARGHHRLHFAGAPMEWVMPAILTASWSAELPVRATAVGISRGVPRGRTGYRRLRELEPGQWFKSVPPERYLVLYREILDRLDPNEVRNQLIEYGDTPVM